MTSTDPARDDALAWLTSRLQWERTLDDLRDGGRRTAGLAEAAAPERDTPQIPQAA